MTPEQIEAFRAKKRAYYRHRIDSMTPDKLEKERKRNREYQQRKRETDLNFRKKCAERSKLVSRAKRAGMTEEEREAMRARKRAYNAQYYTQKKTVPGAYEMMLAEQRVRYKKKKREVQAEEVQQEVD